MCPRLEGSWTWFLLLSGHVQHLIELNFIALGAQDDIRTCTETRVDKI